MSDSNCSGCNKSENISFEEMQLKMEETKLSLESMLQMFQNIKVNTNPMNSLEEKIDQLESFLKTDFVYQNVDMERFVPESYRNIYNQFNNNQSKTPIGYVYVDDNGEQKFSTEKPNNVTFTPVYGE